MKKYSINNGDLILINSQFELDINKFESELAKFKDFDIWLDKRAMRPLLELFNKIDSKDKILPVSGYRSSKLQREIYENSLVENGKEFTRKFVTLPGHSEHETGLAIDLGIFKKHIDYIRPDFPYEGISQKFRLLAPEYGFIERYPKDKTEITKIAHEPWHFRFVGYPHSAIITEFRLSLEEYIQVIKSFDADNPFIYKNYWIWFSKNPERSAQRISGNNVDGFIMTNGN